MSDGKYGGACAYCEYLYFTNTKISVGSFAISVRVSLIAVNKTGLNCIKNVISLKGFSDTAADERFFLFLLYRYLELFTISKQIFARSQQAFSATFNSNLRCACPRLKKCPRYINLMKQLFNDKMMTFAYNSTVHILFILWLSCTFRLNAK